MRARQSSPNILLAAIHVVAWIVFIVSGGFLDRHLDIALPFGEPFSTYVLFVTAPFVIVLSLVACAPSTYLAVRILFRLSLAAFGILWLVSLLFILAEKLFSHGLHGT